MFVEEVSHGPLLHWEIHRPLRLNALGPTIGQELTEKLRHLRARLDTPHPSHRLLYVTAAPNPQGVWIAGGDLKELARFVDARHARHYARLLTEVCHTLSALSIPVVMGLDGRVIGGGLEFALAGDLRLATTATTLDFRQLAIGLATAFGGAARLVKLVGLARAMEWQMLCAAVDAEDARQAGLISLCLSTREALFSQAERWAQHFAALPFASVALQKRMLVEEGRSPGENARDFSRLWRNPLHEKVLARFSSREEGEAE